MPETANQITDVQLLAKIRASALEAAQKTDLESLLPEMTAKERAELLALIDQGNKSVQDAEEKHQKEIISLNEQYTKKMDDLVREETANAAKEFEKLESEKAGKEVKAIEAEIAATDAVDPKKQTQKQSKKSHGSSKFFLFLILLIVIGIAAWQGLKLL